MPESTASHVILQAASKRFETGVYALEKVDLEVSPGEFVGIIGPSGCGKTTLLRMLAGLCVPNTGSVLIDGLDPEHAAQDIAFVFQESTLLPWLNVRQNAGLLHRLRRTPSKEARERCQEALRLVQLEELESRYPKELSGGQKMRVSLARALSVSPRLLLLDEPFGALDEISRERLNEELVNIRLQRPSTALFVTHSVSEAVFVSDRIVIMSSHPGRIFRIVDIPLGLPRSAGLRRSREYLDLVAEISALLRTAEEAT